MARAKAPETKVGNGSEFLEVSADGPWSDVYVTADVLASLANSAAALPAHANYRPRYVKHDKRNNCLLGFF